MEMLLADFFLALSHGEELESVSTVTLHLGQLSKFSGRISPRAQYEDNRGERCGLIEDALQADHGRGDILLSHAGSDKVGDGSVHPVHSEAAQQHQGLEVRQTFLEHAREGVRLRCIQIKPLWKQIAKSILVKILSISTTIVITWRYLNVLNSQIFLLATFFQADSFFSMLSASDLKTSECVVVSFMMSSQPWSGIQSWGLGRTFFSSEILPYQENKMSIFDHLPKNKFHFDQLFIIQTLIKKSSSSWLRELSTS